MSEPTPETHVFVGTFRKPLKQALDDWEKTRGPYVPVCATAGISLYEPNGYSRFVQMWNEGHFDTPVYKTIEEVLAIQATANQGQGAT